MQTVEQIREFLEEVKDPEIPVLSLNDLGVITGIELKENGFVTVRMTPTFAGCPAMDYMRAEVERSLRKHGVEAFEVVMSFDEPWNSNKLSEKGRQALKDFGLAPPQPYQGILDLEILEYATCPNCQSQNTEMRTPFGPTLCRSMHYCNDCRQMFEQFKPL
ncbi:phenylacetate-CoA oxygenase [Rufibacter sp. DG15C]|uniref:1,2-phenylacetyl-CoA epoxidase subunit PaaD n=1 Tax=Rufibacter sp. DG15C TaxID=1379909 RepID=UPI00078EB8FF|nr:1,2-phenylacetyl-CoA epoxidase subunit PaaD [Rufibacter sp. DG15C]AMM49985.1 phenylacetate-CoA oxygenase [Rufibacter sp. DG15C]